jgi:hypothetical protein
MQPRRFRTLCGPSVVFQLCSFLNVLLSAGLYKTLDPHLNEEAKFLVIDKGIIKWQRAELNAEEQLTNYLDINDFPKKPFQQTH